MIEDQKEIGNLTTIDYKDLTWRSTTLLCDKPIEITNAETYAFADLVLCLESISDQPVEAWKKQETKEGDIFWRLSARTT